MGTKILSLTCQVKRGKQEAFERKNPVLASGEPVVVWCKDGTTGSPLAKTGFFLSNASCLPRFT